ncbi:MAG: guanylate kinase [Candidatus Falkowbacteria bacterium]|nr:guanylate kinase [Candidatus Falkowbacteria bacterium]
MQNNLFIISGPSGAGKDFLIEALQKKLDIERVKTSTTRAMRPGESNGNPYYFLTIAQFEQKIKDNQFFEWAEEYNNFYGVTLAEIERFKNCGKICIWKIAYKGVIAAKKLMPEIKAILINAPLNQIEARLRNRDKQLSEEYIQERLEYNQELLDHKDLYDYEIMNGNGQAEKALNDLLEIINTQ